MPNLQEQNTARIQKNLDYLRANGATADEQRRYMEFEANKAAAPTHGTMPIIPAQRPQMPTPQKSFMERLKGEAPALVGGTIGAFAGGPLGAMAGAGAGKGRKQNPQPLDRRDSPDKDQPRTIMRSCLVALVDLGQNAAMHDPELAPMNGVREIHSLSAREMADAGNKGGACGLFAQMPCHGLIKIGWAMQRIAEGNA